MIDALSAWIQLGTPPAPLTALGLAVVVAGLAGSVFAGTLRNNPASARVEAA